MDYFLYRNGILHAEDVAITEIAAAVGTPFYVYSQATLTRHFRVFDEALHGMKHLICYAMKANSNIAILKILGDLGAGMDVVSGGEYLRAKAAGISGDKIVFSGVGKTREEMELAIKNGIRQFNVESEAELKVLNEVALSLGAIAPITLRVNPDVDAKTHAKIATGKSENKFGIPISKAQEVYSIAASMEAIDVVGIDVHIGSQLTDLEPFRLAYKKVAELTKVLRQDGHNIRRLDLGGGLGIPYENSNQSPPTPEDYAKVIHETVGDLDCEIEIEPGRLLAGNAGLMVSSVIYNKSGEGRDFMIIESTGSSEIKDYDIVGPVCETGDTFANKRALTPVADGEMVAFRSAGAYGAVMASEYNTRPLIPEILVYGDQFSIIRDRPSIEAIIKRDIIPDWL